LRLPKAWPVIILTDVLGCLEPQNGLIALEIIQVQEFRSRLTTDVPNIAEARLNLPSMS
jgi:hypothetical protein